MSIEQNTNYEFFIRNVFNHVGRYADPLKLANTDYNECAARKGDLTYIRLGTAYALMRLLVRLETESGDTGIQYDTIDIWIKEIMDSSISYIRIHEIIEKAIPILKNFELNKISE